MQPKERTPTLARQTSGRSQAGKNALFSRESEASSNELTLVFQYVGVYRVDDDGISTTFSYEKDFDAYSKKEMAEYVLRHKGRYAFVMEDRLRKKAKERAGEDEWTKMSAKDKAIAAAQEFLIEKKWEFNLVPVKFVRYDEELYQARVSIKAWAVRTIDKVEHRARVSLDSTELHQYENYGYE